MVFIAYNYDNKIISIVNAYWQGKDLIPHTIRCLEEDFISLDEHITGVYPILSTKEIDGNKLAFNHNLNKVKFIVVDKNG